MKFNKFMIYSMIFIFFLTLGAVNAVENITAADLAVDNNDISETYLENDEIKIGNDISSDIELTNEINEDGSNENSIYLSSNDEINKLNLAPVTIDAKIVDYSRVDIIVANVTGNVIVIVDTDENTVPLNNNGMASFNLNNLSAGNHSLVVIYEGDDAHDSTHIASVFTIPEKTSLIASEFKDIIVGSDLTVSMVLKDKNGNVIGNVPVKYNIAGVLGSTETDSNGLVTIAGKAGEVLSVAFEGNDRFSSTNTSLKLNNPTPSVVKVSTHFNISGGVITVNGYAVDTQAGEEGIYFTTQLLDANGKAIKGVPIQIAVNNKIYDRETFEDGSFTPYKLNMIRAGRYTMALFFNGNDQYSSTFASVCFDLDKKPITIKASAKTFKVSAAKKYSVTLSTIVGSSHDGKVHLSPKKVTLKIGSKTFSAKTNKNGKATFNLKITKKGKYNAIIKYAGDNTYQAKTKSVKITIK